MVVKTLTVSAIAIAIGAAFTAVGTKQRAAQAEVNYPPLGSFIDVTGGKVHFVQEGRGPHLILLHGAGGNLREFTFDLMRRLTDRYTVTAFDRPGLGYTDRVPHVENGLTEVEGASPLDQAHMLREAATEIGIADPIVAGHSYGGVVALAWALAGLDEGVPVNAKAVVSLAGVAMPWPGELDPYYTVNGSVFGGLVTIPLLSALLPQSIVARRIESTFAPQTEPEGYSNYIGTDLTLRADSMRANIRQVNTLRPHVVEMAKRYPELTLPIEFVHGEADETVPISIHAEEIEKIVRQVNTTRLPGIGHMPHHAAPLRVIAAIDRAAARAGLNR